MRVSSSDSSMIPSISSPRRSWSPGASRPVEGNDLAVLAHRQVERHHLVAEGCLRLGEYAVVVGARLVQLGDDDRARHAHVGTLAPQGAGAVVDAFIGGDHEQGTVRGPQPRAQLADEVGVARGCR